MRGKSLHVIQIKQVFYKINSKSKVTIQVTQTNRGKIVFLAQKAQLKVKMSKKYAIETE